jgi:hypothetical protein
MINKKLFSVLGSIAVISIITPWLDGGKVASHELSSEQQQIQKQKRALEGSWRIVVTPSPQNGMPPFNSYATYIRNGSVIQSSINPLQEGRPAHGAWIRTGPQKFAVTFENTVSFNPITRMPGAFVLRVTENLNLTGDTYMGVAQVKICDAVGQQCTSLGGATTVGQRLKVEPLR